MQESLTIVKIGGNVIDNKNHLPEFLKSFAGIGGKKILVHGGGKIATSIGHQLNIEPDYVDGRRITDDKTIDLVTMVYAGLINKKLVAVLQSLNCQSIGITGADASLIPAMKRRVKEVDFGWVGDPDSKKIPVDRWEIFFQNGWIPVVAPITHDGKGNLLNTNADTIASTLAIALATKYLVSLVFCFEKDGVLSDAKDDSTVLNSLDWTKYNQLKETDKLVEGILPKLKNAFEAKQKGVASVVVGNSSKLTELISGNSGTKILINP